MPRASRSVSTAAKNLSKKRVQFLDTMRAMAPVSFSGSKQSYSSSHYNQSLIDRLAFVLVGDDETCGNENEDPYNKSSSQTQQQVWWPAWVFESASEMFQELPEWTITPDLRAALMQEFFLVGRYHPTKARQHVAYLIFGSQVPSFLGQRRTVYGDPTRDFWTISDDVVSNCSEIPGWCDACLAAPEQSSRSRNSTSPSRCRPTEDVSQQHHASSLYPSSSHSKSYEDDNFFTNSNVATTTTTGATKYRRRRETALP